MRTLSVLDSDIYDEKDCVYCGGTFAYDALATQPPADHWSPKGYMCPASGLSAKRLLGRA